MNTILGIFAHPDDEALGPSGTLALLARQNAVYLICATDGDALQNGTQNTALGEIRKKELLASAKVLGIREVFFLGFHDGTLCNNMYHTLAGKIQGIIEKLRPVSLITFEPQGVSGHIDHITVSMVTSFIFQKVSFVKEVWYHGMSTELYEKSGDFLKKYFIYFPPGYPRAAFNKIVPVADVWDRKVKAMYEHTSQLSDVENVLKGLSEMPKEEYFFVKKRQG